MPSYWLRLNGGDHVLGRLVDSPTGEDLAWQAAGFAGPFSVPSDMTQEIQISSNARRRPIRRESIASCWHIGPGWPARCCRSTIRRWRSTSRGSGELQVDRDVLQRMYRIDRSDSPALVYVGPQGLDGWLTTGPKDAWHSDAGQLSTEQPHSGMLRNFGDLPRACYEIDITAKGPPNFSLAFGADI